MPPRTKHLIAHRGASARYPENSILAFRAALDAGAQFLELDVQMSADCIPIVHHDRSLLRMTGVADDITETRADDLKRLRASYPDSFGDRFPDNPLSTLAEFADWFTDYASATAFVEIKRHSVRAFGPTRIAAATLAAIDSIRGQATVISFDPEVLDASRRLAPEVPIGWVLPEFNDAQHATAIDLQPQYLFCKTTRLPLDHKVWAGEWTWVPYSVDTVREALDYFDSGFEMLETNRIVDLLASGEFGDRA